MKTIDQWLVQSSILFLMADERNSLKIKKFVLAVKEDDIQSAEQRRKYIGSICRTFLTLYSQ